MEPKKFSWNLGPPAPLPSEPRNTETNRYRALCFSLHILGTVAVGPISGFNRYMQTATRARHMLVVARLCGRIVSKEELADLRAESAVAAAMQLPWQARGPPGPQDGGPTTWRGQAGDAEMQPRTSNIIRMAFANHDPGALVRNVFSLALPRIDGLAHRSQ